MILEHMKILEKFRLVKEITARLDADLREI